MMDKQTLKLKFCLMEDNTVLHWSLKHTKVYTWEKQNNVRISIIQILSPTSREVNMKWEMTKKKTLG